MTRQLLATGLRHTADLVVSSRLTVSEVSPEFQAFRDTPVVFATAHMVAFVEAICIEALKPDLPENHPVAATAEFSPKWFPRTVLNGTSHPQGDSFNLSALKFAAYHAKSLEH
jgi:hypothetical protein